MYTFSFLTLQPKSLVLLVCIRKVLSSNVFVDIEFLSEIVRGFPQSLQSKL